MPPMKMHQTSVLPALVIALLAITQAISAQISAGTKPIYPINFKPGVNSTMVEGTVSTPKTVGPDMTNEGSEEYALRAEAGQYLTMKIYSGNHQALFTLVKPSPFGSKNEFVENASRVKRWSGRLKMSGDYFVIVFTRAELSRFKLRITLR